MKKIALIFMSILLILSMIACGDNDLKESSYYSYDETITESDGYYENYFESPKTVSMSQSVNIAKESELSNRKLIRDASLTIETKNYDDFISALYDRIDDFKGYVQSSSENGLSYSGYNSGKAANITARIPNDKLDGFLGEIDGLGNVTRKSISTQDVTSRYVDIESRLGVLRDEESALRDILKSADNTTDMLTTQSRLYDVIEEIESYEARIRTYDSLIAYSTVDISIREVVELTPVKEESRGEELARRWKSSITNLKDGLIEFGIWFIVSLPWILLIAFINVGIFLIIYLPIRHKKKKKTTTKQ